MEKLPPHCQENGSLFKTGDYMNIETRSNGVQTSLKFLKIPNFYVIENKECYAAEVTLQGLKIGTATLAAENVLNIKLQEKEGTGIRNLNFLIPPEADANEASVEIINNEIISLRAPLKKKQS